MEVLPVWTRDDGTAQQVSGSAGVAVEHLLQIGHPLLSHMVVLSMTSLVQVVLLLQALMPLLWPLS